MWSVVVIFNKANNNFRSKTGSSQKTGLDVCVNMISEATGIKHVHIFNHSEVFEFLKTNKVKIAIFEALNFSESAINQIREAFGVKSFVHLHSQYPFLALEPTAPKMIRDFNSGGTGVIFNSREAFDSFEIKSKFHLENVYLSEIKSPKIFSSNELNVGCHGSLRHMKNIPAQAIAAIRFCDENGLKLKFHINSTRDDGEGKSVMMALSCIFSKTEHEIVHTKWMDHSIFKNYCEGLDIGMQVSVSETFNLVAADYVSSGLPVVVSNQVRWADKNSQAPFSDIIDIVDKIGFVLNNPVLVKRNQELLSRHSDNAILEWHKFLGEQ